METTRGAPVPSTVSVVIPCYNEARYIAGTLASIRRQDFQGAIEVIVVDNDCSDDTARIAEGFGARVVSEARRGVCYARQAGTQVSTGAIVVSTDADTTHPADWLTKIERQFAADDRVVAVAGPLRFTDGPLWAKFHAWSLFAVVHLAYRMTGRLWYVSATNIAFLREHWPGYDVRLTQGGDELDLLRRLRRAGKVHYDHSNPTFTSGRRMRRGLAYNIFINTLVHYVLAYWINRLSGRMIIKSAPAYRDDGRPVRRWLRTAALAGAAGLVLLLALPPARHYITRTSTTVVDHMVRWLRAGQVRQ